MGNGLGVGHLQKHLGPQTKSPWPLKAQETHVQFPAMTEASSSWVFINSPCWPKGSCFTCQESIIRATIVVLSLSHVWLFATPWTAACQSSLSFTVSLSFLRLMSIESVMPSDSHPLSLPSPPALNLSQHQGLFQWVGSSHQVAKVLELQLQHQSFQWIFRVNFL